METPLVYPKFDELIVSCLRVVQYRCPETSSAPAGISSCNSSQSFVALLAVNMFL